MREIGQPPPHHFVNGRDRAALDDIGQGPTLRVIELGWIARRLAVDQPGRPPGVEAQNPVADGLQPDPADPRRIGAGLRHPGLTPARPAALALERRHTPGQGCLTAAHGGCLLCRVAFRKKVYPSVVELQADLDEWIRTYNEECEHQGRRCFGKTPMQTFLDAKSIAKEEVIAA